MKKNITSWTLRMPTTALANIKSRAELECRSINSQIIFYLMIGMQVDHSQRQIEPDREFENLPRKGKHGN